MFLQDVHVYTVHVSLQSESGVLHESTKKTTSSVSVSMGTKQTPPIIAPPPTSDLTAVLNPTPTGGGDSVGSGSKTTSVGMEHGPSTGSNKALNVDQMPSTSKQVLDSDAVTIDEGPLDFLSPLCLNWPCIVATILGFYPVRSSFDADASHPHTGQCVGGVDGPLSFRAAQSMMLSSVHTLDSFTKNMILNCSEACIKNITATIVEKINWCLAASTMSHQRLVDLLDANVSDLDLSSIDEMTLPIIVGKRFLNSVVRVLAMEHSRIKNTYLEMHHFRAAGREEEGERERERGRGGEGGRGSSGNDRRSAPLKNVAEITK